MYVLQLERVCCLASQYAGRPIEALPPAPSLMPLSLDLDMNMYSLHFADPMASCTDMIPVPMLMPSETSHFSEVSSLLSDEEKSMAMELAVSSVDELVKMCRGGTESLWIRNSENGREVLNFEEHARIFRWPLNLKQNSNESRTEASRDTAVVIMNSITLVDAFLDAVSPFNLLTEKLFIYIS
jgi:hypothetical protein